MLILLNNDLSGQLPSELGQLPALRQLDLDGNDMIFWTGEKPSERGPGCVRVHEPVLLQSPA